MIKFRELDFKLCNIQPHIRECYTFDKDNKHFVCFNLEFIKQNISKCENLKKRKLQATNYLYVPYKNKKIINTEYQLFEIY